MFATLFVSSFVWVLFAIGFVCLWVGKYMIIPFNSRGGVSVGLFIKDFNQSHGF